MHWFKSRWCQSLMLIWMLSGLTGCATTGIALRNKTTGYVAKDLTGQFYFPDDQGRPTLVRVTLPAGSMVQTGGVRMTPEQVKELEIGK